MTDFRIKQDTPYVWADTADYAGDGGARTDQIDLTSIGVAAARQGAKRDLGTPRAAAWTVTARIEFDVAPTSRRIVSIWWAGSLAAAAGTANPGGCSGADAAYTGTVGDVLADSIGQLVHVGDLLCTSDLAPNVIQQSWVFSPELRYGMPVVYNEADQAFEGDAIEMSITLTPLIDTDD